MKKQTETKGKHKKILLITLGILVGLVLFGGLTYAWFSTTITGTPAVTQVSTGTLSLLFDGGEKLTVEGILPGWTGEKTFTVTNTGTVEVIYSIYFNKVINEFEYLEDMQYKISSQTTGTQEGNTPTVGGNITEWTTMPDDTDSISIIDGLTILPGETHSYTLKLRYKETGSNQNTDQGKTLSFEIYILPAELTYMTVQGTVYNEDGSKVPEGYIVQVESDPIRVETKEDGTYSVNGIPTGMHTITVFNESGSAQGTKQITILPGSETSYNKESLVVGNKIAVVDIYLQNGQLNIEPVKYTVTPVTTTNGSVNINNSEIIAGSDAKIELIPDENYEYSKDNCGGYLESENILIIPNVMGNLTCEIEFALKKYEVNVVGSNGTINPTSSLIEHGSSGTFTFTPNTGYEYSRHSCTGGTVTVSGSTLTVSNVTNDISCTVTFTKTYTVTATVNSSTMGSVNPTSVTVTHGGSTKVTITPNSGYEYSTYSCTSGASTSINGSTITVSNVTSDVSCTITFEKSTILLSEVALGSYVLYQGNNGCSSTTKSLDTVFNSQCKGMNTNYVSLNDMGYSYSDTNHKYTVTGWRVAYILSGQAYLISAGSPENVTGIQNNSTKTKENLNAVALKYCNTAYTGGTCSSATTWALKGTDFYYITKQWFGTGRRLYSYDTSTEYLLGTVCYVTSQAGCGRGSDIIDNGSYYWFASAYSTTDTLGWNDDNQYVLNSPDTINVGVRPIIKMSSSVKVTGGSGTQRDPYTLSL